MNGVRNAECGVRNAQSGVPEVESPTRGLRTPHSALRTQPRSGATAVEAAFVLGSLLLILFAMLDLSLAVLRYNTLSAVVRSISREAVVHGARSAPERTPWGPATMSGTCDDGSAPALAAAELLVAVDPAEVSYTIEWLDGDNEIDDRVRVVVRSDYVPVLPFLLGTGPYELTAASALRVMH